MTVIHTQEAHDAAARRLPTRQAGARQALSCGIGDVGPLGRVLVAGEPGAGFVPALVAGAR